MSFVSLVALIALSHPAAAQTANTPPAAAEEKKICKRMEPAVGSIMSSRRVCHTKAQWAELDRRNQQHTENTLERNRVPILGAVGD